MKEKGITLIALVITVVVLLVLAGVAVATITGENGIIEKARSAKEIMRYAEAEEVINLQLMACRAEYAVNKKMDLPEYVAKQNKEIEVQVDDGVHTGNVGTGKPMDYWLMTYDGYTFYIYELEIQGYRKDEPGPIATIKIDKKDYKFASKIGSSVQVEIDVTLPEELAGATVSVAESTEEASGKTGTGTISGNYNQATGKYIGTIETDGTMSTNGSYVYEIKATIGKKDYKIERVVKIENFLADPQIEIPQEHKKAEELKIRVTNNYPQEANISYKYYISETTDYNTEYFTTDTEVTKTGLKESTLYHIAVKTANKHCILELCNQNKKTPSNSLIHVI